MNLYEQYLHFFYIYIYIYIIFDIYGDHSLICGAGSEHTNRHNYVRDTLYHIINSAGLSPSLETANLIPGTIRRPGNVSVNNWSLGKSAAIDISITSPLQNTTILSEAIEVGFAAGERENLKMRTILIIVMMQVLFLSLSLLKHLVLGVKLLKIY